MRASEQLLAFYLRLRPIYDRESRRYTKARLEKRLAKATNCLNGLDRWIDDDAHGKLPLWKEELATPFIDLKSQAASLDQPFRLFVIGMGNAGKSSVINALVGQPVAPIAFTAKTWKIDVFRAADADQAIVRYAEAPERLCSVAEAEHIAATEEDRAAAAQQRIKQERRSLARNLSGQARQEAYEKIERQYGYKSPVIEIDWPVHGSELLQHFSLVDTPGTSQTLLHRRVENTEKAYFQKANGILWVIPADRLEDGSTHKAVLENEARFGRKFGSTIAILNKMDLVQKQDKEHGEERVLQRAHEVYGEHFKTILPLAAKSASDAIERDDQEALTASGLPALLDAIRSEFFLTANSMQLDDARESIAAVQAQMKSTLQELRDELAEADRDYLERKSTWKRDVAAARETATAQIKDFFVSELRRIVQKAKNYEDKIDELEGDERQRFIANSVFEQDYFTQEFDWLRHMIASDITLLVRSNRRRMMFIEYEHLYDALQQAAEAENASLAIDTAMDEDDFSTSLEQFALGGLVGVGVMALLGPIGLVAGLFGATSYGHSVVRFIKGIFGYGIADKIKDAYSQKLNDLEHKVVAITNSAYDEACQSLLELEAHTFAEVYAPQDELDEVRACLNHIESATTELQLERVPLGRLIKGEIA